MAPIIGKDIEKAARLLLAGKPVAFATETVYGLGAAAENKNAIAAMYALKGRPHGHPSILHVADFSEAEKWANIPPAAKKLAAAFFPGALTLLLPAKESAAGIQTPAQTIAVRAPNHLQAKKLLQKTGAVFAPSANRFGKISPTTAAHVRAEFPNSDLYILDGGECAVGIESAIAGCLDGKLFVLRPGAISAAEIARAAQMPLSPPPNIAAPGRLKTHYAPRKPLQIIAAAALWKESMAALSRRRPKVISPARWRRAPDSPTLFARQLYALLRELDETDAAIIGVEAPPPTAEWEAVRDRIFRAGGRAPPANIPQNGGGGGD